MSSRAVPSWMYVERGSAPVLLLAPHGGRRRDLRIPGQHKVNDLRTADVTRALAALLGASVVINERVDRNELDLNRVSQVRRDAPWLIDLVAGELAAMVARWGRATVLVIHGWNVSQIACDVGIGMREDGAGLASLRPGGATALDAFVATRLRPLQETAAQSGIMVTFGSRYPAAHPNNLLQVFAASADRDAEDLAPITSLCGRATVDAAQLELAIPLRWPGPRRDRFLAILGEVFGRSDGTPSPAAPGRPRAFPRRLIVANGRVVRRRVLQLVTDELLVMASIDASAEGATGGRVVVSDGPDRLALFTGELVDPSREWVVPPLVWESESPACARVVYEGPLVAFPSHTPFLDLERGLADGTVVEARLDLTCERTAIAADADDWFGAVVGSLVVDGRAHTIATRGLVTLAETGTRPRFPSCRITLPDTSWGALVLVADDERPWELRDGGLVGGLVARGRPALRAEAEVRLGATNGTLRLEVGDDLGCAERIEAVLERVIPVRRPGPFGSVIATTFALVRVGARSVGWFEAAMLKERAELVGEPDRASAQVQLHPPGK